MFLDEFISVINEKQMIEVVQDDEEASLLYKGNVDDISGEILHTEVKSVFTIESDHFGNISMVIVVQ